MCCYFKCFFTFFEISRKTLTKYESPEDISMTSLEALKDFQLHPESLQIVQIDRKIFKNRKVNMKNEHP